MEGSCGSKAGARLVDGKPLLQSVLFGREPIFYEPRAVDAKGGEKRRRRSSITHSTSRDWINPDVATCPVRGEEETPSFISQSTQTCMCGLLEVDALVKLTHPLLTSQLNRHDSSTEDEDCTPSDVCPRTRKRTRSDINLPSDQAFTVAQRRRNSLVARRLNRPRWPQMLRSSRSKYVTAYGPDGPTAEPLPFLHQGHEPPEPQPQYHNQLEGPFAFHPIVMSGLHARLYYLHTNRHSLWNRRVALRLASNHFASR
ncbi:hypothetical protein Ciccas_001619 [Cichlidogyrus casuarinus]|uniref:Uncharacterized protein n=1 Tax=Cichlidogyrus casuarinus TaxID=1844966 RepID=A0ABD2QJP3_9PLAT